MTKKNFAERLLVSDSYLIDERIIEAIEQQAQIPIVVVIAGGTHILMVKDYLISHGYRIKSTHQKDNKWSGVPQKAPTPLSLDRVLL